MLYDSVSSELHFLSCSPVFCKGPVSKRNSKENGIMLISGLIRPLKARVRAKPPLKPNLVQGECSSGVVGRGGGPALPNTLSSLISVT